MKENVSLETSSSFDIDLIERLFENHRIDEDRYIEHNGYKTTDYLKNIERLINLGFHHSVTIIDDIEELDKLDRLEVPEPLKIGVRLSVEQEPSASYYTSRMGLNKQEILELSKQRIANNPRYELKMLHFFVDSGISDSLYYWGEFKKALDLYVALKRVSPELTALNIGGGFPIETASALTISTKPLPIILLKLYNQLVQTKPSKNLIFIPNLGNLLLVKAVQ